MFQKLTSTSRLRLEVAVGGPDRMQRILHEASSHPELTDVAGRLVWDGNVPPVMLVALLTEFGSIGSAERDVLMLLSRSGRTTVGVALNDWGDELLDLLESKRLIIIDEDVRPTVPAIGAGFRQQLSTLRRGEIDRRSSARHDADADRLDPTDLVDFLSSLVKANGLNWLIEECSSSRPSSLFAEPTRLFVLGCCQILSGNITAAADTLRDAATLAGPPMSLVSTAWLAAALSMSGDHELGSVLASQSAPVGDAQLELLRQSGLHWTRASHGDTVSACQGALDSAKDARDLGLALFEAWSLLDVARFGRPDQSLFRATTLARNDDPLVAMIASAAVAIKSGDSATLEDMARTLDEHDFTLWACEFRALSSELRRKVGLLPLVPTMTSMTGSTSGWTAVTPILQRTQLHGLTKREIEIASMAARCTSTEVAEALFLSVRTVDNLLGRVYRKLGISGRHELSDVFV